MSDASNNEKIAKSKEAAANLARARGLKAESTDLQPSPGPKIDVVPDEVYESVKELTSASEGRAQLQSDTETASKTVEGDDFVPARLPRFG